MRAARDRLATRDDHEQPYLTPRRIRADRPLFRAAGRPGGLGLIDDAGLLRPGRGYEVVVTADALVAGIHFFPDDPPAAIGWKTLAVNLSDLAAKGARPDGFVLTIALPRDWTEAWLAQFAEGSAGWPRKPAAPSSAATRSRRRAADALDHRLRLRSGRAHGAADGRQAGDAVLVSGTIGDGALGLKSTARTSRAGSQPSMPSSAVSSRIATAPAAAPRAGETPAAARLGRDGRVRRAARRSWQAAAGVRVGAEIDLDTVPLSAAARAALMADPALAELAWTGGDDYEISARRRRETFLLSWPRRRRQASPDVDRADRCRARHRASWRKRSAPGGGLNLLFALLGHGDARSLRQAASAPRNGVAMNQHVSIHEGDRLAKRNALILTGAQALGGANPASSSRSAASSARSSLPTRPSHRPGQPVAARHRGRRHPRCHADAALGRRGGYLIGALVGASGASVAAAGVVTRDFALFCLGTFICGLYGSFVQSYRFAAADTASPAFKARAISWVMLGGSRQASSARNRCSGRAT